METISENPASLVFVIVFLVLSIGVAAFSRIRSKKDSQGFLSEYYLGSRSLGAFVLAMTTVATYGSVSSFVGGPGQAWSVGFGWVYMACIQVTALFLLFGIMGKKMALVSRKLDAVTVIDVIRARYNSNAVANVSAFIIVLFFIAMMVAQFVGGAKLFEAVTGYDYVAGLALFGIVVILYTTVGGFRGVAVTDALCGIMMIIGILVLAYGILSQGGGYEQVIMTIKNDKPSMLEPFGGGEMPLGLYVTQWLLVGVFTFCLPQSVVRCMSFKSEKSLRGAMITGTIVIGIMMICMTGLGVLSRGVLTDSLEAYGSSVDNIIPLTMASTLTPMLAGLAITGPIAASISTVSSLLINSSSAIIKDIWFHYRTSGKRAKTSVVADQASVQQDDKLSRSSYLLTFLIGVLVFVLALVPPDVIWKINMFAFGGLETAFCWVLVMGLYWKKANSMGALWSMVGGVLIYCVAMFFGFKPFGLHQIVLGIPLSFLLMVLGSWVQAKFFQVKCDSKLLERVFFPN